MQVLKRITQTLTAPLSNGTQTNSSSVSALHHPALCTYTSRSRGLGTLRKPQSPNSISKVLEGCA